MTNRIQKLVLAAVLAASVPAAALARDCDHDRDDRPPAAYVPPYEAPVAAPVYPAYPAYAPGYGAPAPAQWREARWRERELAHIVERWTLVEPNTIDYQMTVEDPEILTTGKWSAAFPLKLDNDYKMYEYACHEGNTAIRNYIETSRFERAKKNP